MPGSKPVPEDDNPVDATEELVAYLDGELNPKAAEALAAQLNRDANLRAEVEALQRTWDILDVLPQPLPSSTFASRTVSQAIPIAGPSGRTVVLGGPSGSAAAAFPPPGPRTGFWAAAVAIVLAAGAGGYFAHQALAPANKSASINPPIEDISLMRNMRLYRNVDSIESVKALDSPEMFAVEE
jgi:anti-sigma factor RsiW